VEHVKSIYNISSNASNLERVNRWQAAIRMFHERPFFGWGPGTYQFVYAPFQRSKEKTIISTNAGDRGNSHNEYLGPLSEEGVLGMVAVFLIVIFSIYTALKVYARTEDKEIKLLVMMAMLGLITYFTHGFLNNFLDTDKASVPVWGFMAIIVALDLYHTKQKSEMTDP
jgi:O-antigen ligase